ncbi:hypothetical protein [Gordonia aichiensis]
MQHSRAHDHIGGRRHDHSTTRNHGTARSSGARRGRRSHIVAARAHVTRRASPRLADEDATYWLLDRGLGWSVVLQLTWEIPGVLDPTVITAFADRLARGALHRRVVVPRVAGARPSWVSAGGVLAPVVDVERVPSSETHRWATDALAHAALDAQAGRCWQLRAVVTESGDTVLSLCALHLVTDGRGLVTAARLALASDGDEVAAELSTARPPTVVADAFDALRQVRASTVGLVRASRRRRGGSASTWDPRPPRPAPATRAPSAAPRWATVTVSAREWDAVATSHGGTPNTLFIAVIAGLLRSGGYAPSGVPLKVGVPVDRRSGSDDNRANATAGVSIILTGDPVPSGDLSGIRAACKDAYTRLADGVRASTAHLQPLVWLLPPRLVVSAAASGSGMPDAVVSNLGDVDDAVLDVGGHRARRLAFRGMAQGVDPARSHRFGDGVQSWLLRTSDQVTFSVLAFDESVFADDKALRALLADELAAWGLTTSDIW